MKEPISTSVIPSQDTVPWGVAFTVSWSSLRRRFLRSLITMLGVVLGIAFLAYMLVNGNILNALIALKDDRLNVLLQKAGIDIFAPRSADSMMILLIGLSLFTCLVGIINAMLMSVTERIKEIGTLKCLGAQAGFIVKTYFIESSLQGVLGTAMGVLIGLIVAVMINMVSYGGYVFGGFTPWPIIRSLGVSFAIGSLISVAASILPAYLAAKKQPVDAMRVEE